MHAVPSPKNTLLFIILFNAVFCFSQAPKRTIVPKILFNGTTNLPSVLIKVKARVIRVENGEIAADVASPDGTTLLTLTGKTAKHVYKKLAMLDLLSRPDHLMDIGAELEKAEIARDLGIQYRQDQPLHLNERKTI